MRDRQSCFLLVLTMAACAGQVEPGATETEGSSPPPATTPSPGVPPPGPLPPAPPLTPAACALPPPTAAPLRRLSRAEYDNTVRDLLFATGSPADTFPADELKLAFDNNVEALSSSPLFVDKARLAAEQLAAGIKDLKTVLPCTPTAGQEAACAEQFVRTFGSRAFRRPLDAAEVGRFAKLHQTARASEGFDAATRTVIEAMLQAPQFLYRVELRPVAGGALSAYDAASRLSYLLWGSMPDAALFQAAAAGQLNSAQQVGAQVLRMLNDPRARQRVAHFHDLWLSLEELEAGAKDTTAHPWFNDALVAALKTETRTFTDRTVFEDTGTLNTLLTGAFTYADSVVADRYYGKKIAAGKVERIALDPARYAGVFTQPALMATFAKNDRSAPVARGLFINERFLCRVIGSAPPEINTNLPAPGQGQSSRAVLAAHTSNPQCASCHRIIDPPGFGLESFDGLGRWRSQDNGAPVDDSGEIVGAGDADGTFKGARQMAEKIAGSETGRSCMVTQWLRFTLGREVGPEDRCLADTLRAAFARSSGNLKPFIVELATRHATVGVAP